MEEEGKEQGASAVPPRGERIALCTRAMALVLAEMADEDAAEEAGGDAATATVGALPEGIAYRAPPSMQQLRDARLPSPPSSLTCEHSRGESSWWAMRGWSEAWCCTSRPPGRFFSCVLTWLPWSQRSVCALEHAAMAPLFMHETADARAQCAESACGACCDRACSPITTGDWGDGAVLAATAVCVLRAAARVLGCGRESVGCLSRGPPSSWSRLADKSSSCLAPVALTALVLSCLGASCRLSLMRKFATSLMDAEFAQQQAQTICKLRVALSLGLTATANASGKLPPVSRLDKWMSRGSSNGLERSALQALRGALVQYSSLLRADGLGLMVSATSDPAAGPDVAVNSHGTDRIRLEEIQDLRDKQVEARSRAVRSLLAHLDGQHPAVSLLSCAARSSCARAHPRAIRQLAADIHAVTLALGQDLCLQAGGGLPARPGGVLAGMAQWVRRGLAALRPSLDAAYSSAPMAHAAQGGGAHLLIRHSLTLALDMQARAGAGLAGCLALASGPPAHQLGPVELQGMAATCDEAREQLMHALTCVATARDSLHLELTRIQRRAGGALEMAHALAASPSLDLSAATGPETGGSKLAEKGQWRPGADGGRSREQREQPAGVELVFLSHDDKLSACQSPDEEGDAVPQALLGAGVPHDLMRKLQALRGSRSSSSSSSSASTQRDGGEGRQEEERQEGVAGAQEEAGARGPCEASHRDPAGAMAARVCGQDGVIEEHAQGLEPTASKHARHRQRQGLAEQRTRPAAATCARDGCAEDGVAKAAAATATRCLAAASTADHPGEGWSRDAPADSWVQGGGEISGAPRCSSRGRHAYVEELEGVLRGRAAAPRRACYVPLPSAE